MVNPKKWSSVVWVVGAAGVGKVSCCVVLCGVNSQVNAIGSALRRCVGACDQLGISLAAEGTADELVIEHAHLVLKLFALVQAGLKPQGIELALPGGFLGHQFTAELHVACSRLSGHGFACGTFVNGQGVTTNGDLGVADLFFQFASPFASQAAAFESGQNPLAKALFLPNFCKALARSPARPY